MRPIIQSTICWLAATTVSSITCTGYNPKPFFLLQGLRTLVVATKELEEEEWSQWDERYQDAASNLDRREQLVRHINASGRPPLACYVTFVTFECLGS